MFRKIYEWKYIFKNSWSFKNDTWSRLENDYDCDYLNAL